MNAVKRCKICGDVATGFNYQILTCESCKVFFHRNAHLSKKLTCKENKSANNAHCTIDLKSRKKCRHCRLVKCLALGMIRDSSENTNASQSLELIKKQTATHHFQQAFQTDQLLEELFRKSPTFLLSPFTEVTAFTCGHRAANLNDFERFKMAEVESAFALVGGDENRLPMTSPSVIDVYDSFWFLHVAVKVAIRFCRQLEAFNRLKEVDQISLLKSFLFSILMIRFAWSFDFEKDGWPVLKDESATETVFVPFSVFDSCTTEEYAVKMNQFTRSLKEELGDDLLLRDLFIVFTLFSIQQLKTVSNPEIIRYQHTFYSRLLLRYLEQKTKSIQLARKQFLSFVGLFEQFSSIRQLERGMIAQYDALRLPQVIIEVYDLQQQQ